VPEDAFAKIRKAYSSPELQKCFSAIEAIAGFDLNPVDRTPFLHFHDYLTNPQPAFVEAWRSDTKLEKWYHRFVNGILGDVQSTLACVLYHHGRLKDIESSVTAAIEAFEYRNVLGDSTVAIGNTRVLDFEYQAFILAYRRCLDYLARAICTYFRNDFHSFRTLGEFLQSRNPGHVSRLLIPLHAKHSEHFAFVLSEGNRKSLRDKISHYEYVPAGCVNLSRRGFVLAGGGEELGLSAESGSLSEVLDRRVVRLNQCVREMVFGYVEGMRLDEVARVKLFDQGEHLNLLVTCPKSVLSTCGTRTMLRVS
jgi:hypothetical protein